MLDRPNPIHPLLAIGASVAVAVAGSVVVALYLYGGWYGAAGGGEIAGPRVDRVDLGVLRGELVQHPDTGAVAATVRGRDPLQVLLPPPTQHTHTHTRTHSHKHNSIV